MARIRARVRAQRHIYIHNSISNAAHYFKNRVSDRIANDDHEGVGLEIIAGLTLLAFSVEAHFNFLGHKLIQNWNERCGVQEKIELVCKQLSVTPDFISRPFSSIEKLREFRNTLAHGKPEEIEIDKEVIAKAEELEALGIPSPDWEGYVDETFFIEAYEDIDKIWKDLLERSGLSLFDTLTHGTSSIEFIEHVEDEPRQPASSS
ncbi:hypothetical protein [Parvibaculum sp.]|uniref:hypothetical protein n=1 Tax=Parvibaculum sp. TaxID=2024848 RepID=UPI00273104D8|nr:hypothetical protein [Parvibaculum sp.]MDP1627782.1 hypothetical protein [Parvibaculum sp.]MDP2150780.1 hypothetical protein [Parvibaculum sp.]MDP3327675.1 hypothetical protein [Parvibaculum sp.]